MIIDERWFDPYPPGTNANCLRLYLKPGSGYIEIIDMHHTHPHKPYYLYSEDGGIKSRWLNDRERRHLLAYPDTILMEALL